MKLSSKDNHNGTFTITNSTYGFILVMDSHNNVLSVESTTESGVAINNVLNTLTKLKYNPSTYYDVENEKPDDIEQLDVIIKSMEAL